MAADGGPLQLTLSGERGMAEIASPDYPGERLIVCRNKALGPRARPQTRGTAWLPAGADLAKTGASVKRGRNPLRGKDKIGLKAGAVLGKRKMAKHFGLTIADASFSFTRSEASIQKEAAPGGFYVA